MDIKQFQYFDRLSKDKNFSKAAEGLFISQQGLSMAISRLEKELGKKLFIRSSTGLQLTEDGEFLLAHVQPILDEIEQCDIYFGSSLRGVRKLNIACSYGVIACFGNELILDFEQKNPFIKIQYDELPDKHCERAVQSGSVEVGFGIGPIDEDLFDHKLLYQTQYGIIVHKSHFLAQKEVLSFKDLQHYSLIMMNNDFKDLTNIIPRCSSAGYTPKIYFTATEIALIYKMVGLNKGIGFALESFHNDYYNPNVIFRPLDDPTFVWDIHLIKKKSYSLSSEGKLFWNYMIQHYQHCT